MNVLAFNIAISKSAEIPREGILFKSYRQRSETTPRVELLKRNIFPEIAKNLAVICDVYVKI